MRKILQIICVLFALLAPSVFAEDADVLYLEAFEGEWAQFYDWGNGEYTAERVYNGSKAYVYDPAMDTEKKGLNLQCNLTDAAEDVPIYASVQIFGLDTDWRCNVEIRFCAVDAAGKVVQETEMETGATDENGWIEYFYTGTTLPETSQIRMRIYLNGNRVALQDKIYIDNFEIIRLPKNMKVEDCTAPAGGVADLKKIRIWETNTDGSKTEIRSIQDFAVFSVVSGTGYIDANQRLVYTGTGEGAVEILVQYYTLQTTFTITFPTEVYLTSVSGKWYIQNGTDGQKVIQYYVCVYDDAGKIYQCIPKTVTAGALSTQVLDTTVPELPYFIKNPTVKVFACTGSRVMML